MAATAAISAFAPILTVFLGRQSRTSWTDSNTWAAVIFAAAATLIKLYLDMRKWDLALERNKPHVYAYGFLYVISAVFMVVTGFLIIPSS